MSSSKILIIISSALGDFINFLPFLEHINVNYPDFKVILMTKKYYFEIFEFSNYKVDEFIDIENFPLFKLFSRNFKSTFLKKFLNEFSIIISFTGATNNIFKNNVKSINKNSYFIFPVNKHKKIHEVEYILNSFNFKKRFYAKPELSYNNCKKEHIVIHPGSGDKRKNVSIDFFLKLGEKFKLPVKFIGGINEEYLKDKIEITICKSLSEVIKILSKSYFYIGNDSGISHLASALNIPVFTFFGPTNFKIWRPYGENNFTLTKNLQCSPCDFNCKKDFECLKFNVDDAYKIILNALYFLNKHQH